MVVASEVTSASLMAGMPGTEEAARIARCHRGLGVGLHFNITHGRALGCGADCSLTGPDHQFRHRRGVERRALLGREGKAGSGPRTTRPTLQRTGRDLQSHPVASF